MANEHTYICMYIYRQYHLKGQRTPMFRKKCLKNILGKYWPERHTNMELLQRLKNRTYTKTLNEENIDDWSIL